MGRFGAIAGVFVALLVTAGSGFSDEEYVAAMAEQHAGDHADASPAARALPRRAVEGQEVVYAKIGGQPQTGYLARPVAQPAADPAGGPTGGPTGLPGIILIHEWWGLNDNIRSMARQLAGEGYAALAIDVYGGKRGETPAAARALMQTALADPERIGENLRQANAFLREQGALRIGSIGWCFGGGVSLEAGLLLGADLQAVVMYYGRPITDLARLRALRAPLLGLFGAEDGGIPVASARALEANLRKLGKSAEVRVYPGAGHAFANPSGSHYQATAAEDAWARTRAFFAEHLRAR